MDVLIVSGRTALWDGLASSFTVQGMTMTIKPDMTSALDIVRRKPPVMVILDPPEKAAQNVGEGEALSWSKLRKHLGDLLMVDAKVHTCVVTSMNPEEFHDMMEGMGVLCSLPAHPDGGDLNTVFDALKQVEPGLF